MLPDCPVCNGLGWLTAAPVEEMTSFDGHVCTVGKFTPIPCFICGTTRLTVMA